MNIKYGKETAKINTKVYSNLEEASKKGKKIAFGDSLWFGFVSDYSPTQIPAGNGFLSLNIDPRGTYAESSLGITKVGEHLSGDVNIDVYRGLITGEVCYADTDFATDVDNNIFKIIKSKTPDSDGVYQTLFYVLDANGKWILQNPYEDYWEKNPNYDENDPSSIPFIPTQKEAKDLTPYNFKGEKFDYVVWKNRLYICSGKEDFQGSHGISGLMVWDGKVWNSILCGKAGFIDNIGDYINNSAIDTGLQKYKDENFRLYDSPNDFNPSLITLFKERLFIGGDASNPLQIKMSEWNNPDNFVANVLGMQITPLTTADTARPSSFIVTSGCDRISSLTAFNDQIYIGTDKGMYIYDLIKQDIGDNVIFQLETLVQNNYTPAGPVSQYSTVPFQNRLYYLSDYQVVPEFSSFVLSTSSGASKPYSTYQRLSGDISEFLDGFNIDDSTIGIFEDKVLISVKYGASPDNNMTIVGTPFQSSDGIKWGYTMVDYINANYFFQNNRATYFVNSEDGELYKIVSGKYGLGDGEYPTAIWQTGWTGYDPAKDSSISKKDLKQFLLKGYFSKGTEIYVTFTPENVDGECAVSKTLSYICQKNEFVSCIKDNEESDLIIGLVEKMSQKASYRNSAPYYTIHWKIPEDKDNFINYTSVSIRIEIVNSKYFNIESYVGIADEIDRDGVSPISPFPELTEDDVDGICRLD